MANQVGPAVAEEDMDTRVFVATIDWVTGG